MACGGLELVRVRILIFAREARSGCDGRSQMLSHIFLTGERELRPEKDCP